VGLVTPFDVIVVGSGLAGLSFATRLLEGRDDLKIAFITKGYGATPYIAAINAALPSNPWGDTPEQHYLDTMNAGFWINDPELVKQMCLNAPRCIEMLQRWGVDFAVKDRSFVLRRTSGSTYPRSLCQTAELVGGRISETLRKRLIEEGVNFIEGNCVGLLVRNDTVYGVVFVNSEEKFRSLFAPIVVAAWGGVGSLFLDSTYPKDVDGLGLAIAFEVGVSLIDLEFLEFEPMVVLSPPSARGEPCPTALLGEGAYLLNGKGERFLLKVRPEGEAGAPKSLITEAIFNEVREGRGSPSGGVYVDVRHIPESVLKSYPWFYDRLRNAGIDLSRDLVEVGPMAHSHSGGILVSADHTTSIKGLFAVGEAVGGVHGACRLGGNAATQALVSGVLAAESALRALDELKDFFKDSVKRYSFLEEKSFGRDVALREETSSIVKKVLSDALGLQRDRNRLEGALERLGHMLEREAIKGDRLSYLMTMSSFLLVNSALIREESRGNHHRKDFPLMSSDWQCSIEVFKGEGGCPRWRKIPRSLKGGDSSCF